MEHGRDHDERLQKAARPRASNVPTDGRNDSDGSDLEAEMLLSGRHALRPAAGLVGPYTRRMEAAPDTAAMGSNYAPTQRATERELERHRLERERGRVAAGTEGNEREKRVEGLRRGLLDEAAHKADRYVMRPESKG